MLGVIIVVTLFGIVKRQSYTDLTKEENYLQQFDVAELSENLAIKGCNELAKILPDSPIILRVSTVAEVEHLFGASRQKVCIQEIFAGSDLVDEGQEIYITFNRWLLILDEERTSIQRGFTNVMKVGYDYLVFISEKVETLYETIPVYSLVDVTYIAPMFCYEEQFNVIAPTRGISTYVPYSQVMDNEFFAESEEALNAWIKLKKDMISYYHVSSN